MDGLEHDQGIDETRAVCRLDTLIRLERSPDDLIVLEPDFRFAEQTFESLHEVSLGKSVLAPDERPYRFGQYDVRHEDGLGGSENGVCTLRLDLVVSQQVSEQDICVDCDQGVVPSNASRSDSSSLRLGSGTM